MVEQTAAAEHFDLVVIGSGPAGHKAAIQGAKAKQRVLIVESAKRIGGECVRHGTIPSKTLRQTAVQLRSLRERLAGISEVNLSEDVRVASLMTRLQDVITAHDDFLSGQLERNGIQRRHGRARFASPHELLVEHIDGSFDRVTASIFVIAVGSRPRTPDNVPIDHEHVFDSDSWLSLQYLPRSLIVLGGGVIATEYASIFASLGVEVALVDRGKRPLGFLDDELTSRFVAHFESMPGCKFYGEAEHEHIAWDGVDKVRVELADGRKLAADKLLCALGRVANVAHLGLDAAGVTVSARGQVQVDANGRTNVPHIYAAGDVIGPPSLASASMDQGRRAVRHAFELPLGAPSEMIPSGIYSIPEIATIGLDERQARERYGGAICGEANFAELARAHIDGNVDGYMRLVCDPDGQKLLGAQIYGEGATELIHIAQMALVGHMSVDVFIEQIFNFPTLGEAYRVAALDVARRRETVSTR